MWKFFWLIKRKKSSRALIFDSPSFRLSCLFLNFDHLPINSDLETSKKELCSHDTNTKLTALNRYSIIRSEKRHTWPKFVISVRATFSWSVAMCHVEGHLNQQKGVPEVLQARKFYELHTTSVILPCSKGFVVKPAKKLCSLSHNSFLHIKN